MADETGHKSGNWGSPPWRFIGVELRDAERSRPDVCVYLRLTVTDTLGLPVDSSHAVDPLAKVTRTFWYRLPSDWVRSGRLEPRRRERLLRLLYGADWRGGNADGSRYVILDLQEQVLSPEEARDRPWLGDRAAFYAWRDGDELEEVIPSRL